MEVIAAKSGGKSAFRTCDRGRIDYVNLMTEQHLENKISFSSLSEPRKLYARTFS